jgi:nucleotide-binding universal stress UspA family protein
MFRKIIIAVDLSNDSFEIIKNLDGMRAFGTEEILIVQFISLQESASVALSYNASGIEDALKSQKEILSKQGFKVDTRIITGVAKNELNRIAEEEIFSIILVAAEKQTRISNLFLGGLAYDIIQFAKKPVLLIRINNSLKEEISCVEYISCNSDIHILFPTDFSDIADNAFEYVKKMVASGVKKVTLLHIQDKNIIEKYLKDRLEDFSKTDANSLTAMKQALLKHGKIDVDIQITYGIPSLDIIDLVDELKVQMVVMGSQGRGFVKELFLGSVSNNVARQANASVLLVPAKR